MDRHRAARPARTSRSSTLTRSLLQAHTSASSSTSCGSVDGCQSGKSAVRPIEASGGAGFGRQGAFAGKASLHQFWDAEPGRCAKITWGSRMAAQQIGDLAMSPEQRSDQGSAARAVRFRIQGRAFRESRGRNLRLVRVCSLMERRPAAIVRVVDVGTGREQRLDRRHARHFQSGLPAKLTARFSSVLPFVPRSFARRGFARNRASKPATSPDCSALKAAMNGSVVAAIRSSMPVDSPGLSGRPRSRSRAPVRRPAGRRPR